ncbi:MAG: response regulator [Spirochaetota bacterium]
MKDKKIMILNDEEILRNFIAYALEKHGFTTFIAANLEDAAKKMEEEPHVIITHLKSFDNSGEMLVDARRAVGSLPMIVIASQTTKAIRDRLAEVNASGVIEKPFAMDDLIQTLNSLFPE